MNLSILYYGILWERLSNQVLNPHYQPTSNPLIWIKKTELPEELNTPMFSPTTTRNIYLFGNAVPLLSGYYIYIYLHNHIVIGQIIPTYGAFNDHFTMVKQRYNFVA